MKNKIRLALVAVGVIGVLAGCERQADVVSYNLSEEADNFNVVRQITVINAIQGDTLFQMTGLMSIDDDGNQLEVVVEHAKGQYKKHFIGLSDNVTYIVEDVTEGGNTVDRYNYTINFNSKMWIPVDVKTVD
ncbi:TPA: hypothetical protein U1157_001194 [Streptococcus suis]|nr:hypothetical protein [Streptococcus suis]HEM5058341.1 hypothetical protein [Streptococcus suis]HEM5068775.1 hypothetical protein [Streptococcus suis]HEM5287775.1 hypothetical protein [Streptococcus suis]HEM5298211.1 hypothetical protein [Streptococcus suis]